MHPDLWSVRLEMELASVDWEAKFMCQVSSIFKEVVVEISEEQSNIIETIKQDLEKAIHTVCPEAVLTVYGSANCGLRLVSSDVDFSVNIKYTEDVLKTVSAAIKRGKTFKNTESLSNMIPFIRSLHTPSNTKIDLTFDNKATIATTELLAHIMNLDPRVKQLTLLIKIWCQIHCIMSTKCLESISLYMLVIFYLQQEGIVPSVCQMIDKTKPSYVNGYNVAIHKRNIVLQGNKNLLQLLGGFFVFYKELNWKKFVVCPFTALLIPKDEFNKRNNDNLPVEYKDYKIQTSKSNLGHKPMSIQHALFHSRNCSENVERDNFSYFYKKICDAAVIYMKNSNKSFLRKILISPEHPEKSVLINGGGLKWSVTGFSASTTREELVKLFSKYGKVNVENMEQGIAIVKFTDQSGVRRLMSDNYCVQSQGQQLQVKYFGHGAGGRAIGKERFARTNQKNTIIYPDEVDLTGEFDSQLESLLSAVKLTPQEVNNINQLYSDIESVLQSKWPGCKVIPFGSITTGLGIKSSDADCYISGPCEVDQPIAAVSKAKKLLYQRQDLFAEILAITRATTPIVKLFHLPTQTNCDISFKTLGTQNSKLVAFLLKSDAKLIPFSVVIKYWAKIHGLTSTGRMSNYALTMLVIFYLQQPPLNILPAVHLMQNITQRQLVDGWNTAFAELLLPRDYNQQLTIPQLLAGFFHFYAKFDFNKYIVCPYLGRPIEKELFHEPNSLPEEFDIYKNNIKKKTSLPLKTSSAMCVQDPFEQCRNVASTVTNSLAAEIKSFFKFAVEMYDQNDSSDFLKNILLKIPSPEVLKPVKSKELNLTEVLQEILSADWYLCFPYIFKVFLTMKLHIFDVKDKDHLVSICYTSNINKEAWVRCQNGRLSRATEIGSRSSKYLIKLIDDKFMQIGENDISLPVIIKIDANKTTKQCTVIFTLEDHVNDDKGIFIDFTAFVTVQIPIWFCYLHKNADYKKAVALNGYQAIEDVTINTDDVCAVNNNANSNSTLNENNKISPISNDNLNSIKNKIKKQQNTYYYYKKKKAKAHSHTAIEINSEKVQQKSHQNKIKKSQNTSKKEETKKQIIEIKMKKALQQLKGQNWHFSACLILDCIFNELLNMHLKKSGNTNETDKLVSYTFRGMYTRDVWQRCQRSLLSRSTKLGLLSRINRINNKLVLIGDSDSNIRLPITVKIDLQKDIKHCNKVTLTLNNVNDVNAIFNDFNAFASELFPIWFRNLAHLYNTNNFNDLDYRKEVTLNGYEVDFEKEPTVQNTIKNRGITEINTDTTKNNNNVSKSLINVSSRCDNETNIMHSQISGVNSYKSNSFNKEINIVVRNDNILNGNNVSTDKNKSRFILNDNEDTIHMNNSTRKHLRNNVQNDIKITLDLNESNSVTNLHWTISVIKIIESVFSELLLSEHHKILGINEDCILMSTVINRNSWKRSQEYRLIRAMKLGDKKQEKEIVSTVAQVGKSDINIQVNMTVDILNSTEQCQVIISSENAVEDEDRIREFMGFARDMLPEWFSKLLHYCYNPSDTNETSSEDVYLKAIYKIYVEPSLIKNN